MIEMIVHNSLLPSLRLLLNVWRLYVTTCSRRRSRAITHFAASNLQRSRYKAFHQVVF